MKCNILRSFKKTILSLSIFSISLSPHEKRTSRLADFSTPESARISEHREKIKALVSAEKKERRELEICKHREFKIIEDKNFEVLEPFYSLINEENNERLEIEGDFQTEMLKNMRKLFEEISQSEQKHEAMKKESESLFNSHLEKIKDKLIQLYERRAHNHIIHILYDRACQLIRRELDSEYFLNFYTDEYVEQCLNDLVIESNQEDVKKSLRNTVLGNIVSKIKDPTRIVLTAQAQTYIEELKKIIDEAGRAKLRHRFLTSLDYGPYVEYPYTQAAQAQAAYSASQHE